MFIDLVFNHLISAWVWCPVNNCLVTSHSSHSLLAITVTLRGALGVPVGVPPPPELGLTVKTRVADPGPLALVAVIVTLLPPETVGVPEIMPVLVLTVNPAGNPVAP